MDFAFTDEQQMIAETAQAFFRENATSERTRAAMAVDGFDRALWQSFCSELGLAGVALPEAMGGAGLGMAEFAIVAEAAGAQVSAIPLLGVAMASQAIALGGSPEQRERWLGRLIQGEALAAFAHAEDLAVADGLLTGIVRYVPHGGVADLLVIAAGGEIWVIESASQGVTVTSPTTMDQTRPLATVTLDAAQGEKLSDGEAGLAAAERIGWLCLAAEALGGAQEAMERTVAYSRERVQFGRPIGSFQAYKHRVADMVVEIEQARSAVYWAACAVDEGSDEAELALHAAKAFCADTFFKCAADMIQLHGGIGFTWEHDAHLFFKRARSIQTLLGHGNAHRERVATMVLGEAA